MYVVAITRWARPLEQEVAALAPLVGMAAYDLRLRLAGPLPVVFAREADADRARELLAALRERGHGTVACDLAFVPSSVEMTAPRDYAFEHDAFVALDPAGGRRLMPYAEVFGLIRASSAAIEQSRSVEKKRKFSFGRAAMSGGLAMRKTVTKEGRKTAEEREQVLYLVRKNGRDPMILREQSLRHQGLGERVKPTRIENFAALVAILCERAPHALYDERLVGRPRTASLTGSSGTAAHQMTSSSNASETDLAVHLIMVAHLQRQQ